MNYGINGLEIGSNKQVYKYLNGKLYVISDEGHQSGLFGVNSKNIDEVMERFDFNQGLFY